MIQEDFDKFVIIPKILQDITNYYNCSDEAIQLLFIDINKLRNIKINNNIDQWNLDYYKQCVILEKFYKINVEEDTIISSKTMRQCDYCKEYKLRKDIRKCSYCKLVRYCSVACQKRDWAVNHKIKCAEYNNIEYLYNQLHYDAMHYYENYYLDRNSHTNSHTIDNEQIHENTSDVEHEHNEIQTENNYVD